MTTVVSLDERLSRESALRFFWHGRLTSAAHTMAVRLAGCYRHARMVPSTLRDAMADPLSVDARPLCRKLVREAVAALVAGCDPQQVADAVRELADEIERCGTTRRHGRAA